MQERTINFLDPAEIAGVGPRYARHPGPYMIDDVDLFRIFPGIENVETEPYIGEHVKGDANPPNIKFLVKLVRHLEPKTLLEVGTFRGKTTYNLALHAPEDATVVTIDLPAEMISGENLGYGTDLAFLQPKESIGKIFRNTSFGEKIKQIYADSRSEECQRYLDGVLINSPIDFALIDAAHDFESVKDNFENLTLPRLRQNGIVIFDDYMQPKTHVGVAHYLLRKAHDEGYVFYWYAPKNERTDCVLFLNRPESKNRNWRAS